MARLDIDTLMAGFLAGCGDEPFDLASVVGRVRQAFPTARDEEVRWMTKEMVRHLLTTGSAVAGSLTADGRTFRPLPLTPGQVLARIGTDWDELGREPRPGEVAWFVRAETPDES